RRSACRSSGTTTTTPWATTTRPSTTSTGSPTTRTTATRSTAAVAAGYASAAGPPARADGNRERTTRTKGGAMKATLICLVTLLGLAAGAARADGYPPGPRLAPDACGPGFYGTNECGALYGPNYCLHPGYLPWNGAVFGPKGCAPGQYPGP